MNANTTPTVLISGAGVAGPTVAYWLARHGFRPTVVERAAGLRSSGSPVDVRGPAVPVAERMGVMDRLRQAGTDATATSFVNRSGRQVGRVNMRAMQRATRSQDVELTRTDLAAILYEASRDRAEYRFGDTITALRQDDGGVDVTFETAAPRRFDLVIGADGAALGHPPPGLRARVPVRPPRGHLRRHDAAERPRRPRTGHHHLQRPGRMVAIHPVRGRALAVFIFRHLAVPGFDHRDTEQHKRIVTGAYAGDGWRVPELLDRVRAVGDLWLDSVSQVRMDRWSNGRVALVATPPPRCRCSATAPPWP